MELTKRRWAVVVDAFFLKPDIGVWCGGYLARFGRGRDKKETFGRSRPLRHIVVKTGSLVVMGISRNSGVKTGKSGKRGRNVACAQKR